MPKTKITQVDFTPRLQELGCAPTAKLRVAVYARVSTEKEEQEHSLEAQTGYFESYIRENLRWEFVGLYVDDGISGLSYHNREGFNRMVADAVDGKIDLIITKSLSHFARNTVDALTTIRKLKAANVGVFFQKEDINTLDAKGEFVINEGETRVVRFIYMLAFEYYSPSHIARLLMDMHIPSPGGKKIL